MVKTYCRIDYALGPSTTLDPDEVRDRGSPNRESQYPSQGLVVTRRASSLLPVLPSNWL